MKSPPADIPRQLYGYDVIDFIGEGAGSSIYAVSDPQTRQIYAMKHVVIKADKHVRFYEQLANEYEISKGFTDRRLRRAIDIKLTRSLLLRVTDAGLLMELFDGTPLEAQLPRSMTVLLDVFMQTAQALMSLHAMGYVHCDLKPNNIMVSPMGAVKIIDFGQTCKIGTAKRRIQGTPDYIAPEQVKCEPVTPHTDVFNFGATLYWALCGKNLPTLYTIKKSENSFLLDDHMASPHDVNPMVPRGLSGLVMECVRTVPQRRPTLAELLPRLDLVRHALQQTQTGTAAVASFKQR